MAEEQEVIRLAREEASAILAEANEQAVRLLEAAEKRRRRVDAATGDVRESGRELARNIESSIGLLTQILEELRKQIGEGAEGPDA